MTPEPVIGVQTFQQKVAHNFEVAVKSGSTWVVLLAGVAATIYAAMTPEQTAALVKSFPWLAGWTAPLAALAAYVVTRLKPSDAVSTQTKDLIEEVARLRMNDYLRSHGVPELPKPPPTPLPAQPTLPVPPPPPEPMQERFVPPPPLPIDGRLLLSLVQDYIKQQPQGQPLGRGVDFDPSRR